MQSQNEYIAGQRSKQALAFEKARQLVQRKSRQYMMLAALGGSALTNACTTDPQLQCIHELNEAFTKAPSMSPMSQKELLPIDVTHMELLRSLLVMYANDEFIGLRVMPEINTNMRLNGNYWKMNKEDRTAYPEDTVGIGGRVQPNELNETRTETEYNLKVRSFIEFLEWHTVQNQAAPLDEIMDALFNVLYGLRFKQEERIASVVFGASNYASTNKVTLAAADRFENSNGDPMGVFDDAKAAVWGGNGPGKLVAVFGRSAFRALKFHNQLLHRITGGATTDRTAMINQRLMAELLEVDEVVVGSARKNTGTAASPTYARMWTTTSIAIVRVATTPSPRNAAFGYTFNAYPAKNEMFWQPESGAAGCYKTRATLAYAPLVVAADTSYLISSATTS